MLTSKGQRCKSRVAKPDVDEFKNQLRKLQVASGLERQEVMQNMVCLCACNNTHRRTLRRNTMLLATWVANLEAHSHSPAEIDQLLTGYQNPEFTRYSAKSNKDVVAALRCSPLEVPSKLGFVYAFTTPYKPGFVKIGWAASPSKRVAEWAKCFPEATVAFEEQFEYPEQIELLIHLENAPGRMQIVCRRCSLGQKSSVNHDEWFEMDIAEAKRVITRWKNLICQEPLYTKDKVLSAKWAPVLAFVTEQTASGLLAAMEQRKKVIGSSSRSRETLPNENLCHSRAEVGGDLNMSRDFDDAKGLVKLSKLLERTSILDDDGSRGTMLEHSVAQPDTAGTADLVC